MMSNRLHYKNVSTVSHLCYLLKYAHTKFQTPCTNFCLPLHHLPVTLFENLLPCSSSQQILNAEKFLTMSFLSFYGMHYQLSFNQWNQFFKAALRNHLKLTCISWSLKFLSFLFSFFSYTSCSFLHCLTKNIIMNHFQRLNEVKELIIFFFTQHTNTRKQASNGRLLPCDAMAPTVQNRAGVRCPNQTRQRCAQQTSSYISVLPWPPGLIVGPCPSEESLCSPACPPPPPFRRFSAPGL